MYFYAHHLLHTVVIYISCAHRVCLLAFYPVDVIIAKWSPQRNTQQFLIRKQYLVLYFWKIVCVRGLLPLYGPTGLQVFHLFEFRRGISPRRREKRQHFVLGKQVCQSIILILKVIIYKVLRSAGGIHRPLHLLREEK